MGLREDAEDAAAHWIVRRERSDWSADDQRVFDDWLSASMSNRVAYLRLRSVWKQGSRLKAMALDLSEDSVTPALAIDTVVSARSPWRWRSPAFMLAASLFLAVLLVTGWTVWLRGAYWTSVGGLEQIALEDGSRVTLNTDSQLRVTLSSRARKVRLNQGEAYFDVAKDPHRPFSVEAGSQRITAVGTRFSVRYTGNDIQVVVTEGTVRVEPVAEHSSAQTAVKLTAGDIAMASGAGVLVSEQSLPDAEARLSWRTGFIVLQQMPLWEAANEFNRYNDRKIVVADPKIASMRIGGTFRANNIEAFTRLLHTAFGVRVDLREKEIVLSGP